ncbi:MAG: hypothetical protein C5B57_09310 [Blastocatellia bacterium]|nr:MAG: hypothetical protein C5B57_09310 [Blastocatellia bacterium]
MSAKNRAKFNIEKRLAWSACALALWTICSFTALPQARLPQVTPAASAKSWVGQEQRIEEHLKNADVTSIEDIGTGVTHPRRAHLRPSEPVESLVWKVLPPGRRKGYWESYKSEIAAYELDKLLTMKMVPPAVERRIGDEIGAAIMWIDGTRSVKEMGGKVPSGEAWGKPIRRMLMFDNLIGNPDRNAGNILIGSPGEVVLIDHSRAFVTDKNLPTKIERVDAELWEGMKALSREDLMRTLQPWIEDDAIAALVERRSRMEAAVDKLVAKKSRALVIIP